MFRLRARTFCLRTGMFPLKALAAAAVLIFVADQASAHGGYYQGPKTPDGIPLPTHTPGTGVPLDGGPITPPTSGPAVTGRKRDEPPAITPSTTSLPPAVTDPPLLGSAWEHWWAIHREALLRRTDDRSPLDITPSRRAPEGGDDAPVQELRERAVPVLLGALTESSPDVRASAALAVARASAAGAVTGLLKMAAKDESADVQHVAIIALGVLGDDAAVPYLMTVARDLEEAPRRRSLSALALGMIGTPDSVDALLLVVDPSSPKAHREPTAFLGAALVGLGVSGRPEAVEPVRVAAQNLKLRSQVRALALDALGRLGDRESRDLMVQLLMKSQEPVVRQSAALGLGGLATIEDVREVNILLHVARNDRDQGAQSLATLALGEIRGKAVREQLVKLFAHASDNDKPYRALAIGLQEDGAGAPTIRAAFEADGHEESLRGAYSLALGLLRDGDAEGLLVEELGRRERFWSPSYAAFGLALMGATGSGDAIAARLAKATDARQQSSLAAALSLLGDPRGEQHLRAMLARKDSIFESATGAMALGLVRAERSGGALLDVVAQPGERPDVVRAAAISALGRLLDERDEPALVKVLTYQNHHVPLDALRVVRTLLENR